ncbi:hypothetical protein Tco_0086770 [Tanacetum coccineum]
MEKGPIVMVAKHRTVTLLLTSVVRSSGELSASVEREFAGDASVGDGGDQGFDSVGGQDDVEPTVPVTELVLQDSRLTVEQGVPALPTLPFITSSVTASPLEEGGDRTDSVTGPSLRTIGPSARFVVLSDSSHHSGAKSADPKVDSLVRSAAPVMTEATTVATVATTVAIPADVSKDKSAPHPSVFGSSSSSEKTDRTLSFYRETNRGMEHEQLFTSTEFNVSSAQYLSLSSRQEESAEVTQLRAQVSGLEATENSLRGEVASAKDHNVLLEQECNSLKLKVTGLESTIAEKDHELSDLGAPSCPRSP